jgi:hypothetical protein
MVGAQRFNEASLEGSHAVYGCVSNGIQWQFLKLEGQTVAIDLTVYALPPVETILGFFVWMLGNGKLSEY